MKHLRNFHVCGQAPGWAPTDECGAIVFGHGAFQTGGRGSELGLDAAKTQRCSSW